MVTITKKELSGMYLDKNMSMAKIAKKYNVSEFSIGKLMWKHGIETRNKSESHLNGIKKPMEKELRRMYRDKKMSMAKIAKKYNVSEFLIGKLMWKHGIETRTISEAMINGDFSGERNSNWQGGISGGKYCYKFNNAFKEAVRLRDDYTCQLCGYEQKLDGQRLSVHHVHYDKENCYPDVIALCRSCNTSVNSNRDEWEKCFEDDLSRRRLLNWSVI